MTTGGARALIGALNRVQPKAAPTVDGDDRSLIEAMQRRGIAGYVEGVSDPAVDEAALFRERLAEIREAKRRLDQELIDAGFVAADPAALRAQRDKDAELSPAQAIAAELRKAGVHADGRTDALNGKGVILKAIRAFGAEPDTAE